MLIATHWRPLVTFNVTFFSLSPLFTEITAAPLEGATVTVKLTSDVKGSTIHNGHD